MTEQDQQIQLKLQEFQVANIFLNQVGASLQHVTAQLRQAPKDINLMSLQQKLQHDYEELEKISHKISPQLIAHFEIKYGAKFKAVEGKPSMKKA